MRNNVLGLAFAFVVVALPACKSTGGVEPEVCQAQLSKEDLAEISANTAAWLKAVRAADWTATAATYTNDAKLLPPNQPLVSGRESIRKWFAAFPPLSSMDIDQTEVGGCCDTAYVRGTYRLAYSMPGAGTVNETGKYIEIRRKEADGTWLKLRDIFCSDAPPPH